MKISTAKQICKQFLQDAVLRCQGGIDTEAILSMGDSISRIERDQGILLKDMEIARQATPQMGRFSCSVTERYA